MNTMMVFVLSRMIFVARPGRNIEQNTKLKRMRANMKYSDIIRNIDDIFDYFKFHSKNLTKTQEYKLDDLRNLIHELRIVMED